MRGRWAVQLLEPGSFPISRQEQAKLEVLCATTDDLESADARALVSDFLTDGRGVFLLIDRVSPASTELLRRLRVELLPPAEQTAPSNFRYVFMEHPIFQSFQSPDFGNLTDIFVTRYRRLRMTQATPLIFSATGDPLLLDSQPANGKLLILAFSAERSDTDWALHPTFIPFLDRCLNHVCPEIVRRQACEPGETSLWKTPPGSEVRKVRLTKLNGRDSTMAQETPVDGGQVRLQVPAIPGVVALRYDNEPELQGLIVVNPSPFESQLKYLPPAEQVGAWRIDEGESNRPVHDVHAERSTAAAAIFQQRIWWWLLLTGLTALTIETTWLSVRKEPT
jgi:hypothetical protein